MASQGSDYPCRNGTSKVAPLPKAVGFMRQVPRLLLLLFFISMLQSYGVGRAQGITLNLQERPLDEVFKAIKRQSNFSFLYDAQLVQVAGKVSIHVKDASIEEVMSVLVKNRKLSYKIMKKTIILREQEEVPVVQQAGSQETYSGGELYNVKGRVVDEKDKPIPGASVSVKNSKRITRTDSDGYFSFSEIPVNGVIVISSIGYQTQEMPLGGKTMIEARMSIAVKDLDETVVVAYGTTTQRANTGAITVVKGEQIQNLPNRSFEKSLQGLVPGLLITQGTGVPGGGTANFVLRGIATGADPSNGGIARQPLIVMDGVPLFQEPASNLSAGPVAPNNNPLAQLNPSDIETITVLKDAAAIALYGSRASNGVILVTTKKGKEGKTMVGFRHQTDFAERLKSNQAMLNQKDYLELVYETYRNSNPGVTDAAILTDLKTKFPTKADGSFYPQTDWLNELYKKRATTIANELSLSGGNARQTFYLNLEYTKQNGVEKATDFDRKSIRFNYETRPLAWIKLGLNSTASYTVQNTQIGLGESGAMRISPLNPVRDEKGEFIYNFRWGAGNASSLTNSGYFANPVATHELNYNRLVSFRGLNSLNTEVKFLRNFIFSSILGADFSLTESKFKIHPKLSLAGGYGEDKGAIIGTTFRNATLISTNKLGFSKVFAGKHNVNVLAVQEAQIRTINKTYISQTDISSNPITDELATGTTIIANGLMEKETLISYLGQFNYGFLNRYFLSASIRRDGSSLFGTNNQFGAHWSAGGGWVISDEPFLKSASTWLNFLKLRGSVGSAGNSAGIINTLRYTLLTFSSSPFLGGTAIFPSLGSNAPNQEIKWEKTFSSSIGLDLRIIQNRITISADHYKRKTTDLLGIISLPSATGYSSLNTNIGDLKNYGWEFSVSSDIIKKQHLQWNLGANWSANKSRLLKSASDLEGLNGTAGANARTIYVNGVGENYNSLYLVHWAGVDPVSGKPLWIDSTGKESSNWAAAKPGFVGKPQPDGFGAIFQTITWKSISLSMQLNYQYGFQVYADPSANPLVNDGLDPFLNQGEAALNRWRKTGDIVTNPRRLLFGRVTGQSTDGATQPSTRYLIDGDFVRLSNASLTFQLPKQLANRFHISSGSIYLRGSNLATWTKYSGRQDPENTSATGRVSSVYPLQRSFSIGANLNL